MLEYRELKEFPGYRIGNDGSIWSHKFKAGSWNKIWKQLKPWTIKGGYKMIGLNKECIRYYRAVHRLVLEEFIGLCPEGMEGCHNDSNTENNNLDNLRWDTPKNNCKDRAEKGTWEKNLKRGSKHGMAKLTEEQVIEIKKLLLIDTYSNKQIGNMFSVHRKTIYDIKTGKIWKQITI